MSEEWAPCVRIVDKGEDEYDRLMCQINFKPYPENNQHVAAIEMTIMNLDENSGRRFVNMLDSFGQNLCNVKTFDFEIDDTSDPPYIIEYLEEGVKITFTNIDDEEVDSDLIPWNRILSIRYTNNIDKVEHSSGLSTIEFEPEVLEKLKEKLTPVFGD